MKLLKIDGYPTILGPVWQDACEHGVDCYVCSFQVLKHDTKEIKKYDLYVFPNDYYGNEVCIRYGNEGHEYISPGGLAQFLMSAALHRGVLPEYSAAADILRERGKMTWEPREHNPKP